jgi:aryl-alcohol dehydrogenase-like predicted oxidoreductase
MREKNLGVDLLLRAFSASTINFAIGYGSKGWANMEYCELGKTGMKVSILSYGASPLGGVFGDIREPEGIRTVHTALDLGINYIDVAPYYGNTRAETVLGKALKGVPRDSYYLATKVGRYGPGEYDYSAERTLRSIDESLKRLNVDYVDVLQCHDLEFTNPEQILNVTLPAVRKIREQDKARFIGITGLPLTNFPAILDHTDDVDTILSFCHYSLNDTALLDLLPYLEEKGVGIINASPLSMGLLTQQGPPDWHPAPALVKQACADAADFCAEKGVDIAKLAIQFSLSNARVHTTLVGTSKSEKIAKNVRWLEEPLDRDLLEDVLAILAPVHNVTWENT